ncbi:MAG: histidine phosphatase family protein [Oliverpabstia sp.]
MRRIYLIRHGKTNNSHHCIGHTDISLEQNAYNAMNQMKPFLPQNNKKVYTSPLKRARETAQYLYPDQNIEEIADLKEINCGLWENLSFEEIRLNWKKEYVARGIEPYQTKIPGGESYEDVAKRVLKAIKQLLRDCDEDLVLVTHSGCIKSLAYYFGAIQKEEILQRKIKYLSQTILEVQEDASISLKFLGAYPDILMNEEDIKNIYDDLSLSQDVIEHMKAVAEYADKLSQKLQMKQENRVILNHSCLLHDIARREKNHAVLGAKYLRNIGFYKIASIIEKHHDLGLNNLGEINQIDEKLILFYVDKKVQGKEWVSLEERFKKSRKKCKSNEALDNNEKRYQAAKYAEQFIYDYAREKLL